ncbi:hypothetical protein PENVUL_c010G01802 [Penicillium vulpinum]|uniref:LysM domain-containing protein n=1 Tax=Penicillium vulpinum TaxID=29845 RepID=A0A1V6S2A6_9EURO|nr:hypothetical protein PENVUL_c010G01802 [Penicillium vulpinum]
MVLPGVLALLLMGFAGVNADAGVAMFINGSLSSLGLTPACELSLYNSIECDPGVSSLATSSYGGSVDNATLTSLVCQSTCGTSIAQLHDSVAASCSTTAELVPGMPFLALVDQVWSNWNATCFTDPTASGNCNDIIAAFPDVDDVTDLPTADLCSYCNVQQLALLQANAYSDAYTEDWKLTYEAVAQACNLTVSDFDPVQSAFNVTVPAVEVDCISGNTYTTKEGDTCDSIAQTYGVSAATMFYINPNIVNCSSIWTGTDLCLPQTCSSIYTVQDNDTCSTVAADYALLTVDIINFNSQLNVNCSNLVDPVPYWGSTLCVSTPGGPYTGQPLNTTTDDSGSSIVSPPAGSPVATGTTTNCGAWFVNEATLNLTCAQICLSNLIAINLFTEANPSLNKTTCDSDLVGGAAYCVDPLPGWDFGNSTSTTTTTSVPAASTPEAPTQTGIASDCNKYYTSQDGDTCDKVAAEFGITTAQFLAWNPAISSDCTSGFWLEEAYCVGVSSSTTATTTAASTTTTATKATTTTTVTPPAPTQSGIPSDCNKYYVPVDGDNCATVAADFDITTAQFLAWNPAISSDCTSGFWLEEAYCVGVSSSTTATTTAAPTTTTTTKATITTTVSPPAPTQSGIPSNCNKYYVPVDGDNCATVAAEFGITTAQFLAWNPAISSDCTSGFWLEEAYCVGVSS